MNWPRDDIKLDRVRALMRDADVDAVVARAPDNVVYLANYRPMKGYDMVVFPREGEPILIVIEPQLDEAAGTAWSSDLRPFGGYEAGDPRPPWARSLELAVEACRGLRVGLEMSQGTQVADLMVGEPTVFTRDFFEAFPGAVDASPLLAEARAIKTEQEIERMRAANDLAARAMEHVREHLRPGMTERAAAAMWEGNVQENGGRGFSLVWSGEGIRTFTATGDRPIQENEPTLFEIWVCADGYWCDHTKNVCPGELDARYDELLEQLLTVFDAAVDYCRDGADLPGLDRLVRHGIAAAGYPGQPSHPICHGVGARAHEPPYAHQAGTGTIRAGMVLAIEPGVYWPEGGGLRLEDNFLITADGAEKLCSYPDDFR